MRRSLMKILRFGIVVYTLIPFAVIASDECRLRIESLDQIHFPKPLNHRVAKMGAQQILNGSNNPALISALIQRVRNTDRPKDRWIFDKFVLASLDIPRYRRRAIQRFLERAVPPEVALNLIHAYVHYRNEA